MFLFTLHSSTHNNNSTRVRVPRKLLKIITRHQYDIVKMHRNGLIELVDIGANLVDGMFSGIYNGTAKHAPDLKNVLDRSWQSGLKKIIITGTSLEESKSAAEMAKSNDFLYSTVGCHPTNCSEIEKSGDSAQYISNLVTLCKENKNKTAAVGEFGLDYDRLHFCPKETQLKYFEQQLISYQELKLPLFLHCRNAAKDLIEILTKNREACVGGVVHSFDGTLEEAHNILDLGLLIGINGCSLKTEENLMTVKALPTDKILIETDSPWCEIRPTHAGFKYVKTKFPSVKKEKWEQNKMVKGRNEPCTLIQVLEVISGIKEEDPLELGQTIYKNTEKLFFSRP